MNANNARHKSQESFKLRLKRQGGVGRKFQFYGLNPPNKKLALNLLLGLASYPPLFLEDCRNKNGAHGRGPHSSHTLFTFLSKFHFLCPTLLLLLLLLLYTYSPRFFRDMEASKPGWVRNMSAMKGENIMEEEEDDDDQDFGEDNNKKKRALSHSGKRGSGSGGSMQPSCQVEDCATDMTNSKPYHRRHKVCEHHAKAPVVIIAGLRQRFCQQCSRFHDLSEFDDAKKSCRRRLAGHNERRRKSSYESYGEGSG